MLDSNHARRHLLGLLHTNLGRRSFRVISTDLRRRSAGRGAEGASLLAISEATTSSWSGLADVHVLFRLHLDGRELVITEPLLRVAGFLGAFTGMYFTVVLSTDATYREEFAEDVGPQIRQALAVRAAYLWERSRRNPSPAQD